MFNIFSKDKGKLPDDDQLIDDSTDLDSMSFDDLDQDFNETELGKDDRSPTAAVLTGFAEGAAEEVVNTRFINSILRKALPSEYGEVINAASEVSGATTEMYDSAVRETKPVISRLAKRVDRLVPEELTTIKKATRGISEFLGNDYQTYSGMSSEQVQEQGITNTLSKIFGAKEQVDQEKEAKDKAQTTIDKNIEFKKFGASQRLLSGMHNNLERISKYNENINLAYQNKSLELQLRSYFGQKESFKKTEVFNQAATRQLESIVKNTALPEYAKIKSSEAFKEKMRDRFQNHGLNLFSQNDAIGDLAATMKRNASAYVSGMLSDIAYPLDDAAEAMESAVEQYKDMLKTMVDTGASEADVAEFKAKMAGSAAGGMIQQKIRGPIEEFIRDNVDPDSAGMRYFQKGSKILANPAGELNVYKDEIHKKAREDEDADDITFTRAMDFILKLTNGAFSSGNRTLREGRNINNLDNPSIGGITDRMDTTINETIPGYLARILNQLEDISSKGTGGERDVSGGAVSAPSISILGPSGKPLASAPKPKDDFMVHDLKSGTWMRQSEQDDRLWADFNKSSTSSWYDNATKLTIDQVTGDHSPSDDVKKQLGSTLRRLAGESGDIRLDGDYIVGNPELGISPSRTFEAASDEVKEILREYFGKLVEGGEIKNKDAELKDFGKRINAIKTQTDNPMALLNTVIKSGRVDKFVEQGIVDRYDDGRVSLNDEGFFKFFDEKNQDYIKSDETAKNKGGRASKALDTIKNIPIFKWRYKEGEGDINGAPDRAEHVGGMAQAFHSSSEKNFGTKAAEAIAPGGTKVNTIDALGLNMGATQELSDKVDRLAESNKDKSYIKSSEDAKDISGLFGKRKKTTKPPPPAHEDRWKAFLNPEKKAELTPLELIAEDVHAIRGKIDKGTFIISPTIDLSNLKIDMPNVDIAKYGTGLSGLLRHALEVGIQTTTKTVSTVWDAAVTTATFSWGSIIKPTGEVIRDAVENHKGWLWEKIVKFGNSVGEWTMDILGYAKKLVTDTIPTYVKKGVDALKAAGRFIGRLIDPPLDVYVRGSTLADPALIGNLIAIGHYKDAVSGKVILSYGDIKGEVIDGTGKTVLTIKDIAMGLVDKDGKPLKTLAERVLAGAIKGALKVGKKALDLGSWVFGKLGVSVDFLKGIGSWVQNLELDLGFGGKKIHERLVEIRDILLRKFDLKVTKTGTETKPSILKDVVSKAKRATKAAATDDTPVGETPKRGRGRPRKVQPVEALVETTVEPKTKRKRKTKTTKPSDSLDLDTMTAAEIIDALAETKAGKHVKDGIDKARSEFSVVTVGKPVPSVITINSQGEAIVTPGTSIVDEMKQLFKRKRKAKENIISVSTDLVTVSGAADTFKESGLFKIFDKLKGFKMKDMLGGGKGAATEDAKSSGKVGRYGQELPKGKSGLWSKLKDKLDKFRGRQTEPAPPGTLALPDHSNDYLEVVDGKVVRPKPRNAREAASQLHDHMSSREGIVGREYNRSVRNAGKLKGWLDKGKKFIPSGLGSGLKSLAKMVGGDPATDAIGEHGEVVNTDSAFKPKANIVDKIKAKWNDKDASGERDGGQNERLDKLKHDEEERKKRQHAKASLEPQYKGKNVIDAIMDKFGGFLGFMKDKMGSIFTGVTSFFLGKKGNGLLSKVGHLLASPFKIFSKIGTFVKGVAGDALGAVATRAPGLVAGAARAATLARGGAAVLSVVDGGLTMAAMTIGGWALGSPIIIGAAAVAAVAAAGYFGWQWFTKNDIKPIDGVRYRQYGLPPSISDQYHKVKQLEEYLDDGSHVKYGKDGASIIYANIDLEKICGMFDIDKGDNNAISVFQIWFRQRFLPFFLTHLTALYAINPKIALADVCDLKGEEKAIYLDKIGFESGPYNVAASPFKGVSRLSDTKADTLTLISNLRKELVIPPSKDKDKVTAALDPITGAKPDLRKDIKPLDPVDDAKDDTGKGLYKVKPYKEDNRPSTTVTPVKTDTKPLGDDGPAGEPPAKTSGPSESITAAAAIPLDRAGFKDGSGGMQYMKYAGRKPSHWEMVNPYLRRNFLGMIQEYGERTGKSVTVNSNYRTKAEQQDSYNRGGAAKPGHSLHEKGLALDVNSGDLNAMESLGLMRKYGFTRPVATENWHIEPALIQDAIEKVKVDPHLADELTKGSLNKGGGGLGTVKGKTVIGRDVPYAKSLWGDGMSSDVRGGKDEPKASTSKTPTASPPSAGGGTATVPSTDKGSETLTPTSGSGGDVSTPPTGASTSKTTPTATIPATSTGSPDAAVGGKPLGEDGPAGEPSTKPTTTSKKGNPYFIGDSIAEGYKGKGEGDTKVGRHPHEVLSAIKSHLADNPDFYKGKDVRLSTGMSNNPSEMKDIESQMDALKSGGAKVSVYGVSNQFPDGKAKDYNNALSKSATAHGFGFNGGFEAGGDKVHPKSYKNDPATTTPAASGGSASSPVTSPAIEGPVQDFFNKGISSKDTIPKDELAKGIGIMSTLMSKYGYTKVQAAGILGNLTTESHLSTSVDKTGNGAGSGVGMAQWLQPRVGAIEKHFGKKIGSMSIAEQLDVIDWEFKSNYFKKGNAMLRSATDPAQAAKIFDDKYEVSYESLHGRNSPKRLDYAQRYASLPDSVLKGSKAAETGTLTDLKDDPKAPLSSFVPGNEATSKAGPRASGTDAPASTPTSGGGTGVGSGGGLGGGVNNNASIDAKSPWVFQADKPMYDNSVQDEPTEGTPSNLPTTKLPTSEPNPVDENGRPERGGDKGPLYKKDEPVFEETEEGESILIDPATQVDTGYKDSTYLDKVKTIERYGEINPGPLNQPPEAPPPESVDSKPKPISLTGAPPPPPRDSGTGLSNDNTPTNVKEIGRILNESLGVQKDMLSALRDIHSSVSTSKDTSKQSTTQSTGAKQQEKPFTIPESSVPLTPKYQASA